MHGRSEEGRERSRGIEGESRERETWERGRELLLIRFSTEEEALKIANSVEYDLSNAVFTRDLGKGLEFARKFVTKSLSDCVSTGVKRHFSNFAAYCFLGVFHYYFSRQMESGMVHVNDQTLNDEQYACIPRGKGTSVRVSKQGNMRGDRF